MTFALSSVHQFYEHELFSSYQERGSLYRTSIVFILFRTWIAFCFLETWSHSCFPERQLLSCFLSINIFITLSLMSSNFYIINSDGAMKKDSVFLFRFPLRSHGRFISYKVSLVSLLICSCNFTSLFLFCMVNSCLTLGLFHHFTLCEFFTPTFADGLSERPQNSLCLQDSSQYSGWFYFLWVFHTCVSWWSFTGVWVITSLLKSPGLVFWQYFSRY